ncbi:leucyl aminopeptidase [Arenimonas caeni]|uniref:Probable cytosol aminopeptidase n=1 Tax=Arenimonas caeni TaxID=2058085 RepID=A0A2P6MBT0_9GAMM|nr:leucyl aminopeptidase [Arenimonas caeni]PRH83448.1 leucyl aminopeptidase [Arenimonas caeni]
MLQRLTLPLLALLALLAAFAAPAALAQRSLSLAPYALPEGGAVAVAVRKGLPEEGSFAELDARAGGALRRAATAAGFTGDRGVVLNLPGAGPFEQVVLVGLGEEAASPRLLEDVGGLVGQAGALSAAPRIELLWPEGGAEHLLLGADLGQYAFRQYRNADPAAPVLGRGELVVLTRDPGAARRAWQSRWLPLAEAVRFSRDLVTEPASVVYPESFVERTRQAFAGVPKVRIEVIDEKQMREMGMNSLLAVGQGSKRPPRLLVVAYEGGPRGEAPMVFAGKGITFDTGGISLKPGEDMWRMKYDMTGASAVTGAVLSLARRQAPVNVVAVAALAENMPDGGASRPGDVVRTLSGKTFEIMSTDAEGRMVLVDAIHYANERFKPRLIVDVATLTGSVVTALGDEYAGLFTRDDALARRMIAVGAESGEELWRLPLHPNYLRDLASPIADLRNGGGRRAGAGVGAAFIGAWVPEDVAWAHLDIAGMAWRDDQPLPTVPLGASAFGVRLLDRLAETPAE